MQNFEKTFMKLTPGVDFLRFLINWCPICQKFITQICCIKVWWWQTMKLDRIIITNFTLQKDLEKSTPGA